MYNLRGTFLISLYLTYFHYLSLAAPKKADKYEESTFNLALCRRPTLMKDVISKGKNATFNGLEANSPTFYCV